MTGFEMKFSVYADSQEEADDAVAEVKKFISDLALQGKAVTAKKIADAIRKYKNNYFVTNYFK